MNRREEQNFYECKPNLKQRQNMERRDWEVEEAGTLQGGSTQRTVIGEATFIH